MKVVSRFEANLLRLLHFCLHQTALPQVEPLLDALLARPRCLSQTAVTLVQDTLGRGVVVLLTRRGAWRVERHLRDEQIVEGRLWQRTPPDRLGLTFSKNTLDFLMWLTARKATAEQKVWTATGPATLGDLVFLLFAYEQLRTHDLGAALLGREPLNTSGLAWLAFADDHGRQGNAPQPNFAPWMTPVGACVLEALQPVLAERWTRMEVDKGNITDWRLMRDVGMMQGRVLDGFLNAIDSANRLDLARFLLMTATRVITAEAAPEMWTRSLRQQGPRWTDRADTHRGVLAFLRLLPRLQQWERRARSVGYLDEGYRASQAFKADWERFEGDVLTQRAQVILRQLDPMRQTED